MELILYIRLYVLANKLSSSRKACAHLPFTCMGKCFKSIQVVYYMRIIGVAGCALGIILAREQNRRVCVIERGPWDENPANCNGEGMAYVGQEVLRHHDLLRTSRVCAASDMWTMIKQGE